MKKIATICCLFVLVFLGTGCATSYTRMVQFSPADPLDARSADELLDDVNRLLPFQVEPGDFVASPSLDGPSCWVCLGNTKKTNILVSRLKRSSEWNLRFEGYLNASYRARVGLSSAPATLDREARAEEDILHAYALDNRNSTGLPSPR